MSEENKYVSRVEFLERNGEIYSEIYSIDAKHTRLHNELKMIIVSLKGTTETLNATSENTNKILSSIDSKMDIYNDRIKDVEYSVSTSSSRIDKIENNIIARKRSNEGIWTALITAIATILASAFGVAHLFF